MRRCHTFIALVLAWQGSRATRWDRAAGFEDSFRPVWGRSGFDAHPGNASFWSQIHASHGNAKPSVSSLVPVAVIVTGALRIASEAHFRRIQEALAGSECFVVTYEVCRTLASRLSSNTIILASSELNQEHPPGLWQWCLLNRALNEWGHRLGADGAFSSIVRYRTDTDFPPSFVFSLCRGRHEAARIVYAMSDTFFYAAPKVFLDVFSSMFDASVRTYILGNATAEERSWYASIVRAFDG